MGLLNDTAMKGKTVATSLDAPPLRGCCDAPDGKADAVTRRDDAFATLAAAARFGFGSEFYFSRFFRHHHGLSPSQWRRQRHV